jgi:hypothetical protein
MKSVLHLIFFGLFLATTIQVSGQQYLDSKIIITLPDTDNAFAKAKNALIRNEFQVKDLEVKDTLYTYVREYNNLFTAILATIEGNRVTLSGFYNLKKVDDFGYNRPDNNKKRVIYTKGSKTWQLLVRVAKMIGSDISYSQ